MAYSLWLKKLSLFLIYIRRIKDKLLLVWRSRFWIIEKNFSQDICLFT
jgi:hypothetical protein